MAIIDISDKQPIISNELTNIDATLTEKLGASNLNQYTQLELLILMYEEMQAQTKLLKKIYQ